MRLRVLALPLAALATVFLAGCLGRSPGVFEPRKGDEIVVAGRFFHTGTPVVLWTDPGGYDAGRGQNPAAEQLESARGGWDFPTLQSNVDQFVLHFDAAGASRVCFKVLQERGLSVHFMLDEDGTIYQTLDLKERARHATIANDRSIGVEIANIGAYPLEQAGPLSEWYKKQADGRTLLVFPRRLGAAPERTRDFTGRPARREPVRGGTQGRELCQYDFTPPQYRALAKLTAALCAVFPRVTCDYPRDAAGRLITRKLPAARLQDYHGVLGHYHIQSDKVDPGPALQWDYVIGQARRIMNLPPVPGVDGRTRPGRPQLMMDN